MKHTVPIKKLFLFIVSVALHGSAYALFNNIASSVKQLSVNSISQHVLDKDHVIFQGDVEVFVDQKIHLWADTVEVDKKLKTLTAYADIGKSIVVENDEVVMLATKVFLDIATKTGYVEQVKVHINEGYFLADRAQKDGDDWIMHRVLYTPCDAPHPHWHFKASKMAIEGSYFIKASNILFKIGQVPIFMFPWIMFPIHDGSKTRASAKSGFLIPKFSIDYEYGLGIKQEYYKYFSPHCDSTLSVDWRDKRGLVLFDEFRWARAPENHLQVKAHYAIARDSFVQKRGKIFKATDRRYWINAEDFRSSEKLFDGALVASLLRLDFGTDKKIGYHFFNNIEGVDDSFHNSFHVRSLWQRHQIELKIDDEKTTRKKFLELTQDELRKCQVKPLQNTVIAQKELLDRVDVILLPHIEWNTAYKSWGNMIAYRHDFFIDQGTARQDEREKIYIAGQLVCDQRIIPRWSADVFRLNYRGDIRQSVQCKGNTLSLWIDPYVQLRSQLLEDAQFSKNVFERRAFGRGGYRLFLSSGAEWSLPEGVVSSNDGSYQYFLHPLLKWDYLPKFYQQHWVYMDRWDRAYPTNKLTFQLRNNMQLKDLSVDLNVRQSYDFYSRSDIFPLDRAAIDQHIQPIRFDLSMNKSPYSLFVAQEYEWRTGRLLQSEMQVNFSLDKINLSAGYLFQDPTMQVQRELLSNIPHFATLSVSFPVSRCAMMLYDGQFYLEKYPHFFDIAHVKPLLHRIRLDYDGHCWGFYIGFEEKKYREYGNWKKERAIVFCLRLESLGSFAQKFRRPQFLKFNGN